MSKFNHIYREKLSLGAYYTYDKNDNKVYDIRGIRQEFQELVTKLKNR